MTESSQARVIAPLKCRNVTLSHGRTSIRIEEPLWDALSEIARREGLGLNALIRCIWDRFLVLEPRDGSDPPVCQDRKRSGDGRSDPRRRSKPGETPFAATLRVFLVGYYRNRASFDNGPIDRQGEVGERLFAGTPLEIRRKPSAEKRPILEHTASV